jgi:hypothetical protein
MRIIQFSLRRVAASLGVAAGLFFAASATTGLAQTEIRYDKWVDGGGHCPASCDPKLYNCPCAVIYPT